MKFLWLGALAFVETEAFVHNVINNALAVVSNDSNYLLTELLSKWGHQVITVYYLELSVNIVHQLCKSVVQ